MSDPLEVFRKQAKQLVRWHHEGDYSVGGRVRGLARFRELTDREILAREFSLGEAQEIIAREQGFETWAALRAAIEGGAGPEAPDVSHTVRFTGALPVLFVRDVRAGATFFERQLGFTVDFLHGHPPFYAGVSRDGARLHLRFVHRDVFDRAVMAEEGSLLAAFVTVQGVKNLYAEYLARGVPIETALRREAWGGNVFSVLDPDGNRLHFVE
jgi:uncharacterized glyoxalase superfamily protein PhnB